MSKNLVLMREIVCVYHPEFSSSRDLRKYGLKHPEIFNIERLVEESLAAIGPYSFVNSEGYDFSDFSDSKTTSVNINTRVGSIGNVETKIGALRITAYNPFKGAPDYFFVPKNDLKRVKSPCYGINSHKERILFKYAARGDKYGWFEDYRVNTFVDLAKSL